MKFGKRLAAEAERQWREYYIDYKACKKALQSDVDSRDPHGHAFERTIKQELEKVSFFYANKEQELQGAMEALDQAPPEWVASFSSQVKDLRKYVVLNYICVVKAAKKRNRHLKAVCGEQVVDVKATHILSHQYFFTSPKLASMATHAEILSKELQPVTDSLLQDYQCPICLAMLRGAVVLTCAHRFCWGCLVAHCTTVMSRAAEAPLLEDAPSKGAKEAGQSSIAGTSVIVWEGEHSDEEQTLATFDCPVCRKAQLLDLDQLQVDPHLDAFVRKLESQGQQLLSALPGKAVVEEVSEATVEERPQVGTPAPPLRLPTPGLRTSTEVPLLSVEDMDAVLEYLHKEHETLEREKNERLQHQHQQESEGLSIQRTASQPVAISTNALNCSTTQQVDEMEVDFRPSVRSSLLATTEDDCEEATSKLRLGSAVAPLCQAAPCAAAPCRKTTPPRVVFSTATAREAASAAMPEVVVLRWAADRGEPPLLPSQRPEDKGKITVCLDLDGTLVSTFIPKRAPLLPSSAISYVVGRGGKLNPGGVFVVERPGLQEFFQRIEPVAEVVLFTAGLEDYAAPICDALEAKYNCFLHRLYRPACVPDEVYPCIKDMSRLGRDLKRCVLVDDTPLAFFRQPDNGIPVLNFRGDVDDQLLTEAVAPLIESLAGVPDVRTPLARRFNMTKWFQTQGLMVPKAPVLIHRAPSMPTLPRPSVKTPSPPRCQPGLLQHGASGVEVLQHHPRQRGMMLVCDFDRTLIDYDAGERLCDELAPELTSLLSSMEMPANFVPVTNTVFAEMQRRGVSRDKILSTLRTMGQEVPLPTVRMLQWASRSGIDVRVISDCNSVVINHVLAGAKVNSCVREVITNLASFVRVEEPQRLQQAVQQKQQGTWLHRTFSSSSRTAEVSVLALPKPASQRLMITPRHPYHECSHGCPLCPENLCKGQELEAIFKAGGSGGQRQRIIYCGDGANDLCPALCLGPQDVVLARKGYQLDKLIQQRREAHDGVRRVIAQVRLWSTHEELWLLAQETACT